MRLAIIASGWHFPLYFYKSMAMLRVPNSWELDLFCVSHREPTSDIHVFGNSLRSKLDQILYKDIARVDNIIELGWNYKLYPNTIGDWGCANQWLDDYNYKLYDMFLFTHDDNLIIDTNLLIDMGLNWGVLCNSVGTPIGSLRGSFNFFKKEVINIIGGKFDLSKVHLSRVGKTDNPKGLIAISDWNNAIYPTQKILRASNVKIRALSQYYRFSKYCIEGERGLIQNTYARNTEIENYAIEEYRDIYSSFIEKNGAGNE